MSPARPPADDPAALLAEMATVRGRIETHAAGAADAAERSKDWTVYVRAAPLACAAGAAVAGYLLVPSRSRRPAAKIVTVAGGKGGGGKGAAAGPVEKPVAGKGPWMGALSVLGNVAVRAGTAYLSQKAGAAFGSAAADPEPEPAAGSDPFSRNGRPAPGRTAGPR